MSAAATIQLPPLKVRSRSQLFAEAKRLGMAPGDYARQLIEEGLAFRREAERKSFAEIMRPVREQAGDVDDAEIVKLVKSARPKHRSTTSRTKRSA